MDEVGEKKGASAVKRGGRAEVRTQKKTRRMREGRGGEGRGRGDKGRREVGEGEE